MKTKYFLELFHQVPGGSDTLKLYSMDVVPPVYNNGTSISIDGTCYTVMDTLVGFEEVFDGIDAVLTITHQVRVK